MASTLTGTLAENVLQAVKGVTVETAYLPTIRLNQPFAPGPPNALLSALKPKISIDIGEGAPIVMTPYGDPGTTKWPVVALIFVGGAFALGYLAYRHWNKR